MGILFRRKDRIEEGEIDDSSGLQKMEGDQGNGSAEATEKDSGNNARYKESEDTSHTIGTSIRGGQTQEEGRNMVGGGGCVVVDVEGLNIWAGMLRWNIRVERRKLRELTIVALRKNRSMEIGGYESVFMLDLRVYRFRNGEK